MLYEELSSSSKTHVLIALSVYARISKRNPWAVLESETLQSIFSRWCYHTCSAEGANMRARCFTISLAE